MARYTFRCDDDLDMRIKALKERTSWSFQKLTEEFYKTLLYKLQTEGTMFNDLTNSKQIEYVVKDMAESPIFAFFRIRQKKLDKNQVGR